MKESLKLTNPQRLITWLCSSAVRFTTTFSSLLPLLLIEACSFTVLAHSHCSHSIVSVTAGSCFSWKSSKKKTPVCYLPKQQTDKVSEHLAAKEPNISLRSWKRPKTELKEREYWTFIRQKFIQHICEDTRLFLRNTWWQENSTRYLEVRNNENVTHLLPVARVANAHLQPL